MLTYATSAYIIWPWPYFDFILELFAYDALFFLFFLKIINGKNLIGLFSSLFKSLFFFFFLFIASSAAYGSFWARGQIGSVAAVLYHSRSNTRFLTHWVRPGIKATSSQILCWVHNPLRHTGNSKSYFKCHNLREAFPDLPTKIAHSLSFHYYYVVPYLVVYLSLSIYIYIYHLFIYHLLSIPPWLEFS